MVTMITGSGLSIIENSLIEQEDCGVSPLAESYLKIHN